MFDRLEDLVRRYEEITNELTEPSVVNDQNRFRKLMKEQAELQPLVDAYTEYKKCRETAEDSLAMLEEESDEEMREMLKEELSDAKKRTAELEQQMKILLLPNKCNRGDSCRRGGRRSGAVCSGDLPDVCALCGNQTLESRNDGSGRDRYWRYEKRHLYDNRSGCIFGYEI